MPNNTKSPRTELLLSYSCTVESNASGCDPHAVSIYNSTGDPVSRSPRLCLDCEQTCLSSRVVLASTNRRAAFVLLDQTGHQSHGELPCTRMSEWWRVLTDADHDLSR